MIQKFMTGCPSHAFPMYHKKYCRRKLLRCWLEALEVQKLGSIVQTKQYELEQFFVVLCFNICIASIFFKKPITACIESSTYKQDFGYILVLHQIYKRNVKTKNSTKVEQHYGKKLYLLEYLQSERTWSIPTLWFQQATYPEPDSHSSVEG